MSKRLLNVKETAARLGVSPKTIYQWAQQRRIPSVKLGGRSVRFEEDEIETMIESSRRKPWLSK